MTYGPQPGQQVQRNAYYGYPQQLGYQQAPQRNQVGFSGAQHSSSGTSGVLVALFLAALVPMIVTLLASFLRSVIELGGPWYDWIYESFWYAAVPSWLIKLVMTVGYVAAVTVLFRSNVGRWILVVTSSLMLLNWIAGMSFSTAHYGNGWSIYELLYIPVIVIAFLPPVNRAFRKSPSGAGRMPSAYAGQPMQPQQVAEPHGYAQQQPHPQQQQAGYPNQPWQQGQPPQQPPQQYPPR